MGTCGLDASFFYAVLPFCCCVNITNLDRKSCSREVEGGRNLPQFISWRKSAVYMAPKRKTGPILSPKRKTGPIPTGWALKTLEQNSQTSMYYCPATGQHFYTYFELMRYVKYAMEAGVSIYEPSYKSVKRTSLEKDSSATNSRKTSSILSLRKKPSSESKSSIVEQSMDPQLSTSSESSDREKDEDYVPESETNVGPDFK